MKPKGGHSNHEEINFTLIGGCYILKKSNEYFPKEKQRNFGECNYVGYNGSYDLGP